MKATGEPSALVLPPAFAAEVETMAAEEQRPALDVLQDAMNRYSREKRWRKIRAYGEVSAKRLGLTEDDIPRLIAESRAEQRQVRE